MEITNVCLVSELSKLNYESNLVFVKQMIVFWLSNSISFINEHFSVFTVHYI